jgi:peptide/nickel transport system permease protein
MSTIASAHEVRRGRAWTSRAADAVRFVFGDPALAFATVLILVLVALATIGPLVWPDDPLAVDVSAALQAPSWSHPMGTDGNGRDILARFMEGARISLVAGIVVVVLGALVGGLIGVISGVAGSLTDNITMRALDSLLAFPPLILAMAVTVALGVGVRSAVIGITLTSVPYFARLLRTDILRIRSLPHVEAAVAVGATRRRIVLRHILPHATSSMLIQSAAVFGYAVLSLAALSFVGLGAQIPEPEWGAMISDGLQYALTGQWWIAVFPGLGLLAAVVAANVIADRTRDILDPRGDTRIRGGV